MQGLLTWLNANGDAFTAVGVVLAYLTAGGAVVGRVRAWRTARRVETYVDAADQAWQVQVRFAPPRAGQRLMLKVRPRDKLTTAILPTSDVPVRWTQFVDGDAPSVRKWFGGEAHVPLVPLEGGLVGCRFFVWCSASERSAWALDARIEEIRVAKVVTSCRIRPSRIN